MMVQAYVYKKSGLADLNRADFDHRFKS